MSYQDATLMTAQDLAERWAVSLGAVYKINHCGTGPVPIKIGRRVRYRLADVEAWEESNYTGGDQQ